MLNRPYNVNIVNLTNDTKKYIRHSEYTAYTDGSKIDGKAGAGVIIYKLNKIIYRQSYSLPSNASIFQAVLGDQTGCSFFLTGTKYTIRSNILKSW